MSFSIQKLGSPKAISAAVSGDAYIPTFVQIAIMEFCDGITDGLFVSVAASGHIENGMGKLSLDIQTVEIAPEPPPAATVARNPDGTSVVAAPTTVAAPSTSETGDIQVTPA